MFTLVKKVLGIKASPKHATLAVQSQVKAGRRGRGKDMRQITANLRFLGARCSRI